MRNSLSHFTPFGIPTGSPTRSNNGFQLLSLVMFGIAMSSGLPPALAIVQAQPQRFKPFEVEATDGSVIELAGKASDQAAGKAAKRLTVVYFTGIECPLARLYAPRIATLATEFSSTVDFIGLNSNLQDSEKELTDFHQEFGLPFACAKDVDHVIADQVNVQRTPEVFLLDQDLKILYRGRIDDQYSPGVVRAKPLRADLRIAIEEALAGKPISEPKTEPEGCLLTRRKASVADSSVTFSNQVARILQQNCLECHRSGEIGPFALDSYDEVVGWGEMIVEVIDDGRMPPWHADPQHGTFLNERRLTDDDKQLLRTWVANGMPPGDLTSLPEAPTYVSGWRLPRDPDVVIPMRDRPFTVPADGSVEYQYFVVDPKFTEDKWVMAAEVRPGNRSIVHHSIVFVRPPDGEDLPGIGWLTAYVPGQQNIAPQADRARRIPAGSKLVFQQHYTPNGTEQADVSEVGIVFANDDEVREELLTIMAIDQRFEIKPHEADHRVRAKLPGFPRNGKLLSVSPHMHYRGKSFAATLRKAGQQTSEASTLVSVPNYDFNWQHVYQFAEPIPLRDVRSVEIEVAFDNSAGNPFNPDPTQYVRWGDQTWEEMAIGFFDIAVPRSDTTAQDIGSQDILPDLDEIEEMNQRSEAREAALDTKVDEFVNDFFKRFDKNNDGVVTREELPLANQRLTRFSSDGEPGLTREEVAAESKRRFRQKKK